MSPLILLVLEPEGALGDAALGAGLSVWCMLATQIEEAMRHTHLADGGHIDVLNAFLGLYLSIDAGSCCGYGTMSESPEFVRTRLKAYRLLLLRLVELFGIQGS